jgi:hypothetical protein
MNEPEHILLDRTSLYDSGRRLYKEWICLCLKDFLVDTHYRNSDLIIIYRDDYEKLLKGDKEFFHRPTNQNANTRPTKL